MTRSPVRVAINLSMSQFQQENLVRTVHITCLKVVAEGVETEEQLTFLKNEQCDMAQGYCSPLRLELKGFLASLTGFAPLSQINKRNS